MLVNFFLSGHMFPLDMLPAPWDRLVGMLPLKYLAYYPAAIFLGKVPREELVGELWIEAGWVLFFMVTARVAYRLGVRRYSGYGG
jgi:ABC-2 type transport system permease protein